ncbi:hypothetical protein KP509_39G029300 [Ceratopteris richardii]|nr:hypothetical protein KP509_39G029300 [Ceratopteris richardii]
MGNIEDDSVIKEYIEAVQKNTNTLEKEESSITGFKSLDANLTHDENSNQTKESSNVDDEPFDQQPDKKICLGNTWSRSLEPSITTNNVQGPNCFGMKQSFDVIDIESDNEEGCKSLRNASGIELPTGANDSGTSCSQPDVQTVSQEAPPLDEEHNTHVDCSGILKEQTLPHVNGMATCSCLPMSMHCVHGVVCQCQKAGFMQGTPFHQMNASSLNDYGHGEMNKASKWQNGDNAATDSATSQVCSKKSHSQAEQSARILHYDLNSDLKNIHHTSKTYHGDSFSENVIDNGDRERTHEVRKVNSKQYFYKGSSHHVLASQVLLVKNLEKDIIPSKALQVVREVTSGALLMYVWPAMDYETTKKGYIYYEDSESAKAAYEKFSAGLFLVASSKGRPWIVSQVPTKQIDQLHLHHILSAVGLRQEDETEEGEGGCGHLLILHRGSQEFPFAKAKLKLFLEQQKKLQCHYKIFRDEEDLLLAQQREL